MIRVRRVAANDYVTAIGQLKEGWIPALEIHVGRLVPGVRRRVEDRCRLDAKGSEATGDEHPTVGQVRDTGTENACGRVHGRERVCAWVPNHRGRRVLPAVEQQILAVVQLDVMDRDERPGL